MKSPELSLIYRLGLLYLSSFALSHGVDAFVIVVRRGRFTDEQDRALRVIKQDFGVGVNSLLVNTRLYRPAKLE